MDCLDERSLAVLLEWDSIYQQLLKACMQYEVEYQRICDGLCEEDRLQLTRYISLCEELDHRRLLLALSLHNQVTPLCFAAPVIPSEAEESSQAEGT